jgi:hypothetical protein
MPISLSSAEVELIRRFTEGDAIRLNEALRHPIAGVTDSVQQDISNLDYVIARSLIAAPFRVYRGIGADFAAELRARNPKPGALLTDAGFLCTSLSLTVARRSAYRDLGSKKGLVLAINSLIPTNGIAVAAWSAFPEEQEVILKRDTTVTILSYDAENSIIETRMHHGKKTSP